jgi:hypothetical protein
MHIVVIENAASSLPPRGMIRKPLVLVLSWVLYACGLMSRETLFMGGKMLNEH